MISLSLLLDVSLVADISRRRFLKSSHFSVPKAGYSFNPAPNMHYLFEGTVILFAATFIFYLVFLGLVYYWHEKKTSYIIIPLIYTFNFFLAGFLVMSLALILIEYLPQIINRIQ